MTLNINVPSNDLDLAPKITVIGVGGAGGNAVNNMITSKLSGVEFLVANTDAQALQQSLCDRHVQLGRNITRGLGAGSRPDIGRAAAEESMEEVLAELQGSNMVFVTAGMGGGTGTGAASVIARAARESGILTVGVVTKPFHFEGVHRMRLAESGINELTQFVDTLIIIPNQNLFRVANEKTTFADAFKMADDVLDSGVRGVTDLMVHPGLINLDFADIRSVMSEMGKAMMGTGEADGDNRAVDAAEAAISNPLLDDVSMKGARGVLINITGGMDLTLFEVDEAANRIRDEVDPEANIIFGSTFNQGMEGKMRVSVVATGIDAEALANPKPVSLSVVTEKVRKEEKPETKRPEPFVAKTASAPARAYGDSGLFGAGAATAAKAVTQAAEAPEAVLAAPQESLPEPEQKVELAPREMPREMPREIEEPLFQPVPQLSEPQPEPAPAPEPVQNYVRSQPAPDRQRDSFFAPPPVDVGGGMEPSRRERAGSLSVDQADAVSPAALEDPREAIPTFHRKAAQSLFAKVTGGAARALHAATGGHDGAQGESDARPAPAEPSLAPKQQDTTPSGRPLQEGRFSAGGGQAFSRGDAPAAGAPGSPSGKQTRLTGFESKTRVSPAPAEEEMLDIPAFLRRQAN